jgi:hypothetical protein
MGVRFECPNGHRLHVKAFLAGKRGICPECEARFVVPAANGGRTEAVANGAAEIVPQVAAPAVAPPLPEIKLSTRLSFSRRRRSRRVEKAKAATFALSGVVFLLLLALVLVLIR